MRRRRDRGIALLLALLVLAILIVLVGQMAISSLHNRTVVDNHVSDLRNTYGARSGYHYALLQLQADLERAPQVDSLHERWSRAEELTLGEAKVRVEVRDAERSINLSHLVNDQGETAPAVADHLRRLLRLLGHPPDAAERIIDYVDGDNRGAYEGGARNERLYNVEELLRIEGIAPEVVYGTTAGDFPRKGLAEFVTVWPRGPVQGEVSPPGAVNANTAPVEVLATLSDQMTTAVAEAIAAWRSAQEPDGTSREYKSAADLMNVPGMTPEIHASIAPRVVANSRVFEVRARSRTGSVEKAWAYVVHRVTGQGAGMRLLSSHRVNDFLSVRPPEEEEERP